MQRNHGDKSNVQSWTRLRLCCAGAVYFALAGFAMIASAHPACEQQCEPKPAAGPQQAADQQTATPQTTPQQTGAEDPVLLHRLTNAPDNATIAGGQIRLDVVVTDAGGKPVTGLAAQDFNLLADKQPQKLVSFEAYGEGADKPEQPVQLIIVIDTVNNGFSELGLMRQGLEQFLRQNGGQLAHPVSLLLVTADGVQTLSPPSSEGQALAAMVEKMKPRVRNQGIETFPVSIMALAKIAQDESQVEGRRLLVWLGPGWETAVPNPTVMTARDERNRKDYFDYGILLSTRLRQARIALYGGYADSAFFDRDFLKGVRKVNDEDPRDLSLNVLALQSGGRGTLAQINRDSDVADQLNSFAGEADAFYTQSFNPALSEQPGTYHDLKVVIDKPGLTARTNTGYYGQDAAAIIQAGPSNQTNLERALGSAPGSTSKPVTAFVGKPITVAELEELVAEDAKKHDGTVAKELYELRLTERLATPHLTALEAQLSGAKSRAALVALADASAFLALPPAEIPSTPAPDFTEQRRIVALAVDYLRKTIPRLPNFYATRTTQRYEDTREDARDSRISVPGGGPVHWVDETAATVIYRDHQEVIDNGGGRKKYSDLRDRGLVTRGTFGPILSTVMVDAAHGTMAFGHWEQGADKQLAVFRFAVPQEQSHYDVAYQSPPGKESIYDLNRATGYHGEIGLDPETGAIVRLTLIADIDPGLSLTRADIMVEYGPVEIGSKTYICPLRSVSYSQGRAVMLVRTLTDMGDALGPPITRLNDVAFGNYHVFRTEMRILTGDEPGADGKQ
jgi:VWFA-related protein